MKKHIVIAVLCAAILLMVPLAHAQVVAPVPCLPCTVPPAPVICTSVSCSSSGTASQIGSDMRDSLEDFLKDSAHEVEEHINEKVDDMVETALESINETELRLIDWWKGMWKDKLLTDMQKIVQQLNVANAESARALQAGVDAYGLNRNKQVRQEEELQNQRDVRPNSATVGTTATLSGGFGRANNFAEFMRNAWQWESLDIGLNSKGSPGASGAARAYTVRSDRYKSIFCDPDGNSGTNDCAATDPKYFNADTQPNRFIFSRLTVNVTDPADTGRKMAKAVSAIIDNMVGTPAADNISLGALKGGGQETFLNRRSYLARYAAIRSVPQLEAGWRMPGSKMGEWTKPLRKQSGVPDADIAENPSYREVLHAASIDRVNSGRYAIGMVTDDGQLEMEKLTLDAFYLMQLRDYYELLERTALVLAVQVSMMADQAPMPDVMSATKLK